jgi:hypothetical protein
VLAIRSKQSKNRARKNVGAFRRKRQDYATWKGRVGVHVETDEIDLKNLVNVIYKTLGTEWELGESFVCVVVLLCIVPLCDLVSSHFCTYHFCSQPLFASAHCCRIQCHGALYYHPCLHLQSIITT